MGLTPGTAANIAFRVRADVNQYNGAASTINAVYSNAVTGRCYNLRLKLLYTRRLPGLEPGRRTIIKPVVSK